MARIIGKIIRGTVGPVVHKGYRGIQVMAALPKFTPSSQTKETKKAAAIFGRASKLAMEIRDNLDVLIQDMYDGPMIARFNTVVLHALRRSLNVATNTFHFDSDSFERLNGFEFNEVSPVRNQLFVQPTQTIQDQILTVSFPEIRADKDLKFPETGSICLLNVAVVMYDLTHGRQLDLPIQSTEILSSGGVNAPLQLEFEIAPGCLCITAFSLLYVKKTFAGTMIMNSKAFNPVAIFRAVMTEGETNPADTKKWLDLAFKTQA